MAQHPARECIEYSSQNPTALFTPLFSLNVFFQAFLLIKSLLLTPIIFSCQELCLVQNKLFFLPGVFPPKICPHRNGGHTKLTVLCAFMLHDSSRYCIYSQQYKNGKCRKAVITIRIVWHEAIRMPFQYHLSQIFKNQQLGFPKLWQLLPCHSNFTVYKFIVHSLHIQFTSLLSRLQAFWIWVIKPFATVRTEHFLVSK